MNAGNYHLFPISLFQGDKKAPLFSENLVFKLICVTLLVLSSLVYLPLWLKVLFPLNCNEKTKNC